MIVVNLVPTLYELIYPQFKNLLHWCRWVLHYDPHQKGYMRVNTGNSADIRHLSLINEDIWLFFFLYIYLLALAKSSPEANLWNWFKFINCLYTLWGGPRHVMITKFYFKIYKIILLHKFADICPFDWVGTPITNKNNYA